MLREMDLVGVFRALGQERCSRLVRSISIGAIRTFKLYEAIKVRSRLRTLNRQKLRAAVPKLWARIDGGDADLAHDLAQAVLVSHIALVVGVLDSLGIEHDGNGFFSKDADHSDKFGPGWPEAALRQFGEGHPPEVVLLYINYLGWETGCLDQPFLGPSDDGPASEPGPRG